MSPQRRMTYVRLGNSGLKVSRIILGTMYGDTNLKEWVLGEEEAIKQIKSAYDAGIQTFDTANVYSNGVSEVILGKAIKELKLPRQEIVIMTKVFFAVTPGRNLFATGEKPDEIGYVNQHGLSRKPIFESVKASLERLQLDYVDILQCHRFDPATSIAETMQALHDVVQAGYVRYIGMSSCWAWQFHAMQNYAIANKLTPFISVQNHHNLVYREEEREMFPTLKLFGVGSIPWSPLAEGLLARPLAVDISKRASLSKPFLKQYAAAEGTPEILRRVESVAKKININMAQVALAWSLSKEGVTAPIVGVSSLKHLEDAIDAAHVKLTDEDIKFLEEPYKAQNIIGHT